MSAPKASSATYQLVIVEDEAEIRDGLTNVVNWESVGFSVAAAPRNGREAQQYDEADHRQRHEWRPQVPALIGPKAG